MFQTRVVDKIKHTFYVQHALQKSYRSRGNVEKYDTPRLTF